MLNHWVARCDRAQENSEERGAFGWKINAEIRRHCVDQFVTENGAKIVETRAITCARQFARQTLVAGLINFHTTLSFGDGAMSILKYLIYSHF